MAHCTHILMALALVVAGQARADDALHDPLTGLRVGSYRAPVPDRVPGGQAIALARMDQLQRSGALLIDVMGAPGHRIGPDGAWMLAAPHRTIPGALWLPEVGHGRPEARFAAYLTDALAACDRDRPVVVFCRSDCWMSWNAVQHIAERGFSDIAWYPGGVDEWADLGRALVPADPLPLTASACPPASEPGSAKPGGTAAQVAVDGRSPPGLD